jgi:hypothetical protein
MFFVMAHRGRIPRHDDVKRVTFVEKKRFRRRHATGLGASRATTM